MSHASTIPRYRSTINPSPAPNAPVSEHHAGISPSVLVVLLNWNSSTDTVACVHSVLSMHYTNLSILIIDNGSADDSLTRLRPLVGDRVKLLELPTNTGFTGGCNLGFRIALERGDDFVWLLNNDALADAGTLTSLVRLAESDHRIGLVSPRIVSLQNPGKDLNLGGLFRPEIPSFQSTKVIEHAREWAQTDPSHVLLMGTALLVRTGLLRRIGLFDDSLFAYWEDTDLSLRAIKAGFRNVVDFGSHVFHQEKDAAQALGMKPHYWYYMARNECRFWRKHTRGLASAKALWWTYLLNVHNLALLRASEVSSQALIAGLWDGWIGRTGPFAAQRRAPKPIAAGILAHARRHAIA